MGKAHNFASYPAAILDVETFSNVEASRPSPTPSEETQDGGVLRALWVAILDRARALGKTRREQPHEAPERFAEKAWLGQARLELILLFQKRGFDTTISSI